MRNVAMLAALATRLAPRRRTCQGAALGRGQLQRRGRHWSAVRARDQRRTGLKSAGLKSRAVRAKEAPTKQSGV